MNLCINLEVKRSSHLGGGLGKRTIVFYHFIFDFTTSLEIYFDPSFEATTLENIWMNASVVLLQEARLSFKMLHLVLAQCEF